MITVSNEHLDEIRTELVDFILNPQKNRESFENAVRIRDKYHIPEEEFTKVITDVIIRKCEFDEANQGETHERY